MAPGRRQFPLLSMDSRRYRVHPRAEAALPNRTSPKPRSPRLASSVPFLKSGPYFFSNSLRRWFPACLRVCTCWLWLLPFRIFTRVEFSSSLEVLDVFYLPGFSQSILGLPLVTFSWFLIAEASIFHPSLLLERAAFLYP